VGSGNAQVARPWLPMKCFHLEKNGVAGSIISRGVRTVVVSLTLILGLGFL
jgi:hypothetical protein